MDAFRDKIAQRATDTTKPALATQCRGRELQPAEVAFATALMEIYGTGTHDFDAVAAALTERGQEAPRSGKTEWTAALLQEELVATNAELDAAYAENGYGA